MEKSLWHLSRRNHGQLKHKFTFSHYAILQIVRVTLTSFIQKSIRVEGTCIVLPVLLGVVKPYLGHRLEDCTLQPQDLEGYLDNEPISLVVELFDFSHLSVHWRRVGR